VNYYKSQNIRLIGKNLTFRYVQEDDAQFILELRLDPRLNKYISKTDSDIRKQIEWIKQYKLRQDRKQEYYFIIIENNNNEKIGTTRIYNFSQNRYTSGSLIIKKGSPLNYFVEIYQICTDFAFETLGFTECAFANRKANKKIIDFNTRFGACKFDEDELNVYFLLDKLTFNETRKKMLRMLNLNAENVKYRIVAG